MYRFLLRPRWLLFHVVVVTTVVLMVNLGLWQLRRLHERSDFNTVVTQRMAMPTLPLDEVLKTSQNPAAAEWQMVQVTGQYVDAQTVVAVNRSQGGFSGKDPLTPLALDDGRLVLINRGFLPLSAEVPTAPQGRVEIEGRLRISEMRHRGQLSDPAQGILREVIRINLDRLSAQMPSPLAPFYIELLSSNPADSAQLSQIATPIISAGAHLSYTVQWFTFSLFVIAGWVVVVRRKLN